MYSSVTDIANRIPERTLIELSQDDPSVDKMNTSKIEAAIADADGVIDEYLQEKYKLPLTTIPQRIKRASVDLAIFYLYSNNREMKIPETVQDVRRSTLTYLQSLQDGLKSLPGLREKAEKSEFVVLTNKTSADKRYGSDFLERYL